MIIAESRKDVNPGKIGDLNVFSCAKTIVYVFLTMFVAFIAR